MRVRFLIFFLVIGFGGLLCLPVFATEVVLDTDGDGVNDYDETEIYHTNPYLPDTDGDGYTDRHELINGYSPWEKTDKKMEFTDFDKDGLSDRLEIRFGTDPTNPDTDGDGYKDGEEINSGFDPASSSPIKLSKRIEISLARQELSYYLGKYRIGTFLISSGVNNTTPKGVFKINSKNPKAWSSSAKLWMPYWMAIIGSKIGLHELPYWPNGQREGEKSLGRPASHGCIRMGRNGEAKSLYEWAEIGTPVTIK